MPSSTIIFSYDEAHKHKNISKIDQHLFLALSRLRRGLNEHSFTFKQFLYKESRFFCIYKHPQMSHISFLLIYRGKCRRRRCCFIIQHSLYCTVNISIHYFVSLFCDSASGFLGGGLREIESRPHRRPALRLLPTIIPR